MQSNINYSLYKEHVEMCFGSFHFVSKGFDLYKHAMKVKNYLSVGRQSQRYAPTWIM